MNTKEIHLQLTEILKINELHLGDRCIIYTTRRNLPVVVVVVVVAVAVAVAVAAKDDWIRKQLLFKAEK